jgi:hypothetical protein
MMVPLLLGLLPRVFEVQGCLGPYIGPTSRVIGVTSSKGTAPP